MPKRARKENGGDKEVPPKRPPSPCPYEDPPVRALSPGGAAASLRLASWNVGGLRAWIKKGGLQWVQEEAPDVLCLQETKCAAPAVPPEIRALSGLPHQFWASPEGRPGYSGVGLLARQEPLSVTYGIGDPEHDAEGRVVTAEFPALYVVAAYVPNSGRGLVRLPYRQRWDRAFRSFLATSDPEHDAEGRVVTAEFPALYVVAAYVPNSGRGLVRLPYRQRWDRAFRSFLATSDPEHDAEGRVVTAEFPALYVVAAYVPNSGRGLVRLPYRQRWDRAFRSFLATSDPEHDAEGRVVTAEFPALYVVAAYVPNSGRGLVRLPYRQRWDRAFRSFLANLDARKPVAVCGDLNVAHAEIDLRHPRANRKSPGFTDEEREGFGELLGLGFLDTFRHLYPAVPHAYTFWTYLGGARGRNVGWRLDYCLLSRRLEGALCDSKIRNKVMGSDHCPVEMFLAI